MPDRSILLKNMMQVCRFEQKESSWMHYDGSQLQLEAANGKWPCSVKSATCVHCLSARHFCPVSVFKPSSK
jgi:hypothetical protein